MNPIVPWPPCPPPECAPEEEKERHLEARARYKCGLCAWTAAMHHHNRWWKQFGRFFIPWRSAFEVVPARNHWGPELGPTFPT